jgi:hypothetical protein
MKCVKSGCTNEAEMVSNYCEEHGSTQLEILMEDMEEDQEYDGPPDIEGSGTDSVGDGE